MTGHPLESSVLNQLKTIPADVPIVVLMRHSIRGPLPEGSAGNDIPITDEGWRAARSLGAGIGHRIASIHTSPVRRCVETAQAIVEGSGILIAIHEDRMLGAPGAFVLDSKLAWENWQRLGHEGVMRHLAEHDDPLPGMARPFLAARMLVRHLLARADGRAGVHLFVTHDAVLSPVASRVITAPAEQCIFPEFLEAVVLWQENDQIHGQYREWNAYSLDVAPSLSADEVTEFARREIGRTIGLRNHVRFFLAGGAFKSILTGRDPRDLDLWSPSPQDRENLIKLLLERGATTLAPARFGERFEMAGRTIDVPLRTEPEHLADRLARFDIAMSAIGVEFLAGEPVTTIIHPLALESVKQREMRLLKPLVNWRHSLSTLARLRRYGSELGFRVPAEEEEEVWRTFTAQDAEMRAGMIERYLPVQSAYLTLEEIGCRNRLS